MANKTIKIPEFLYNLLSKQYSQENLEKIISGLSEHKKTCFRINSLKASQDDVISELKKNNVSYTPFLFYKDAYYLNDDFLLQNLNIYKDGKIYLQNISSMLPPLFLNPQENTTILDMAAAPGSKTTQIAALTNNKASITACEMNKIRYDRLQYNLDKQGVASCTILKNDARNLDSFFSFDQILLDAPCSGSGTIRPEQKNIDTIITPNLLQKTTSLQTLLLKKALEIIKKGHYIIYSTCSILAMENEDIINPFLKQGKISIVPLDNQWIKDLPLLPTTIPGTLCIRPTALYEGFYVAKIKKIK